MLRIAVLDDENHALERFETVVKKFKYVELCGLFDDADDLLNYLREHSLDAVFVDIEMPGKTGLQLAGALYEMEPDLAIVFLTAFSQYAVEAFELSALDYILKPVSPERLKKTLERIDSSKQEGKGRAKQVTIHCFPRFECRIDDKVFPLNHLLKAKELLAYLVSRKGAEANWEQIVDALWPDMDYEKAHNNLHVTTFRLRKWLSENNIAQIFESRRNSYRVVPLKFSCDLFDLEKAMAEGDKENAKLLYRGDFFEEEGYEWAYPIQAEWAMKMNSMGIYPDL